MVWDTVGWTPLLAAPQRHPVRVPHLRYDGGMQPQLMEILVCPMCHADLRLDTTSEADGEIMEGSLTCTGCGERYPIEDGIPNLLPPDQRD